MVTQEPEKKKHADYSLRRVAELAGNEAVSYAFTRVQMDIENLGYSLTEVCECLSALRAQDFSHSERYGPTLPWNDVYKVTWGTLRQPDTDLYIKFRMDRDLLIIELCSFHQPRNL